MLQKVLQAILRRYFGQYLTGLQNVQLAFWTGRINIQNASFKHDKINELIKRNNLPFSIKFSYIGSLEVDIPWNKLSSAPVQVIISDIFIVLKLQAITFNDLHETKDDLSQNSKFLLIKKYAEYLIKKSFQMKVESNESGYLNRLLIKILHNMNIKIQNISCRIENQGIISKDIYVKKDDQEKPQEQSQQNITQKIEQRNQRKLSQLSSGSTKRRRSTAINVSEKPFALGFCIKKFNTFTIDENGQRNFINVESQNVKFSKMIELNQISLYWEEVMSQNLYTKSLDERVNFLKGLIQRKQYRLLTIDGNILLKRNHNQHLDLDLSTQENNQFTYSLLSQFKQLSIQANYEQIRQMILIIQTMKAQKQKVSLMKLKQLQKKQQFKLQKKYKEIFLTKLYPKNFKFSNKTKDKKQLAEIQEISNIFQGVQKKILMKWTKQTMIQVIKKQKQSQRLKQKNKKGWFNFFSNQQDQIQLDQDDLKIIEQQIKSLIALTQQKQIKSFVKNLTIQRLVIKIKKQIKAQNCEQSTYSQQIQLYFDFFSVKIMKFDKKTKLKIDVKNIGLIYSDFKANQRVEILQITQGQQIQSYQQIGSSQIQLDEKQPSYALQLSWQKVKSQSETQKVIMKLEPMKFKHEIKVLSFISHMLKLRHGNKQIKSDLIIFKAKVQSTIPEEQIDLRDTIYQMDIKIKKISVLIQLNENSYLNVYIQNIGIDSQEQNVHKLIIKDFGLRYVKKPLSIVTFQSANEVPDQIQIVNDFSIQVDSKGLKRVDCRISPIRVTLCEDQMRNIYGCLMEQTGIFSSQKKQYEKEKIIEHVFLQGKVSIINAFRVKCQYLAVLYYQSIALYPSKRGIQNLEQLVLNQDQINPSVSIPLAKLRASKKSQTQIKLQSLFVNEIFQLENEHQVDRWLHSLDQRIFQIRAKSQIQKIIQQEQKAWELQQSQNSHQGDQKVNLLYKYETQVILRVQKLEVLYSRKANEPFIDLGVSQLKITLQQNNFNYHREIRIQGIQIENRDMPDCTFNKLLSNLTSQDGHTHRIEQIQENPIVVVFSGKKKLHPNYTGQLEIDIEIKRLLINFDAQLLYAIIQRIAWQKQYKVLSKQQRDKFVLDYFIQILQSDQARELQEKISNSEQIKDSSNYIDIDRFKNLFTTLTLLKIGVRAQQISMFLIQGRTSQVPFEMRLGSVQVDIDKGKTFFFIKAKVKEFVVDDLTGYPNTNRKAWSVGERYRLISTVQKRTSQNAIQFYYSSFPTEFIVNKNRFRSFILIEANDLGIVYQNQPLMRFVDYLTNQLITFFMEPHSLRRFDQKVRGQFKYGDLCFRQDQIQEYITNIALPFFNELKINASNLVAYFNTFPNREAIQFNIDKVIIYPLNQLDYKRISFNVPQLIEMQRKYPEFQHLSNMQVFQQNILKSQWSNRLIIRAQGMSSDIVKQKFDYQMYFERSLHQQKQFLLPCVKINKDLVQEALIKNLTLIAPKNIYNLINKCFMFNLSYDDELDCQYITNFQHQNKVAMSELVFKIKINQFTLLIPEINQTAIIIEDMGYKFIRYPDMLKQMGVSGRAIHILGQKNFIVPFESKEQKGLQFIIQMKQNGQKIMSTFFRAIQIVYDWDLFSVLLQYFLLDDSCYPPQRTYPDLPLMKCHFYFLDSYIRIAKTDTHYYALHGDITFSWIKKKLPHPQTYRNDKKAFPTGKEGSLYLAKLKDCNLKKLQKKNYQTHNFTNYRLLSHPINLDMKWSNVMKISPAGHQYTDFIVDYDVKNLFLKLSYVDIEDMKKPFTKQNGQNQPPAESLPYTQYTQHIFNFNKFTVQLGVSELPVPLFDVTLQGKALIQLIDKTTSINLQIHNLTSKYWNMLIGRWQPILQKLCATSNFKFTKQGTYVIFDSPNIVYLDVSMDSLKVLNLISDDFNKKGKGVLNLFGQNMVTSDINISPYVITNRTSLTLYVSNPVVNPTKLLNNEKIHLQTNFLQNIDKYMGTIFIKIQDQQKLYEIDLNICSVTKIKVKFKQIQYDLFLHPISSPVVKQIVITSPYVLSNLTSHKLVVSLHNKEYLLNPYQKQAIPFYQIIEHKQFKLQFPHLCKPTQNYPFMFKDIEKGYQHYINLQGQQFNCSLSLKRSQNKEEENQIQIQIAPVYYFKNLLPLDIFLEFNLKLSDYSKLIPLRLQVNQQKEIYELNTMEDIFMRLKLRGYHFSEFVPLSKSNDANYCPEQLMLHDHRALDGKIKIKTVEEGKTRKVYLYCDAILINQTIHDLYTFNQSQLLSGQKVSKITQSSTKYTFIDPHIHKFLNFGFNDEDPFRSNQFDTVQLGNQQIEMLKSDKFYEFTLNNTLHCVDSQAQIYTNVLKVMPKYILVNSTSRILQLKQRNTQKVTHLMSSERISWIWSNNNQQKLLSFRIIDNQAQSDSHQWDFSSGLDLQKIEDTVLVLHPFNKKQDWKILIKIQVHKEYQQNFIVFKQLVSEQFNRMSEDFLIVQNDLKLARVQFYQNCFHSVFQESQQPIKPFKANPGDKVLFGWQNPQLQQQLHLKIQFLGPLRSRFKTEQCTINVKQKKVLERRFINSEGEWFQIQFVIQTIGLKKIIKIRQKDLEQSVLEMGLLGGGNKVGISLHELGVSLISSGKNRKEVLYMSFKKFQVILMEESQVRKIQVKIKYISIDNNSNHNTIYPVFFTPLKHEKTWSKSRPFFVMLIETNLNKEATTQIKQFRMCLQSISLKIHDEVLVKLYDMYRQIGSSQQFAGGPDLNKIFRSYYNKHEWQQKQVKRLQNEIFFREFQIAKLSIEISFSIRPKINKGNYLIFTILSSFGVAISNVSESQLTLSRFLKKQVTLTQLKNQMSQFYVKQVIKGIYKILGSITIFGNPYVFIRLLAEGAWQVVNQPTEGFIKGPIEGTIGIAKGGIFFTRNVVAGTFNSFEAISQSLSRGISYLTMDQKFIQRREKIKIQKSNHVFQGVANGLFAFYTGFEVALTGLYRLPVQGYKKEGLTAGVTGAFKGITGLVTKPISGMFQGISKVSQGIKNTALLFQDGPNTKRARHPRIFLTNQKYYTNYNHLQSYTIAFLEHLSTKYLNIQILFISVTENIQQNVMKSLVLTSKYLLIVDLVLKIVETQVVLGQIQTIQVVEDNLVRILTKYDQEIQIQEQPEKCQQLIQAFKMSKKFL